MRADPRAQALLAQAGGRYPLTEVGQNPAAYAIVHVALVDDNGFMYRRETQPGPTRVVALLQRTQPAASIYISMDLATGTLREDPAPYGWTYMGAPR
ncbi:MAG: hypothetical protein IPK82_34290 [Polyangiaceae bacterium]|nr:hypothetical protein [Polyangiaceae bacterium]